MGYLIQQSTTAYELLFLMVDSTDHVTGKTGLSPTVTIRKAGGSFATPAGAVSEIANGWYKVAGNATDSGTLGPLVLHATGTAADPVDDRYEVVAFNPQDAVRLGLTALPNAAADAAGGLPISAAGNLDLDAMASGSVVAASVTGSVGSVTGAVGSVTGAVGSVTGNVGGNVVGSVASVTGNVGGNVAGSVGSVTGAINTAAGTITTLDALDTAQDTQHGTTQSAISGLSIPTAGAIADQVWEEAIADHSGTAGSTAEALGAAGSAGDPWTTALPGSYTSGQAGKIVGDALATHTPQTGDSFARIGAPAGASVSADVAAVKTDTGNLVTRITSTLFTGITSLAQWLGLMAGKQTGNSTARTELRATGAGSGTFDESADSLEAVRDNQQTAAAAALTAYDPPTRTEATADKDEVLASVAAVDAIVDAILVDTDTTIPALIAALNNLSAAQVNAEVADVINTDTGTELSAIPAAAAALRAQVQFLYQRARNVGTQTASAQTVANDAGATIGTAAISDDGTTFTRGKFA